MEPFLGEIRLFAGNFAPLDWAFCDGSLLPIAENVALYNLIGTIYGGDGVNTFALPDLRSRVPVHQGQGPGLSPHVIGEVAGQEAVTLMAAQMPSHNHVMNASTTPAASGTGVAGSLLGSNSAGTQLYGGTPSASTMAPQALTGAGGGQPHNNMAPYLGLNFIIALYGVYPSQF